MIFFSVLLQICLTNWGFKKIYHIFLRLHTKFRFLNSYLIYRVYFNKYVLKGLKFLVCKTEGIIVFVKISLFFIISEVVASRLANLREMILLIKENNSVYKTASTRGGDWDVINRCSIPCLFRIFLICLAFLPLIPNGDAYREFLQN